MNLVNPKSGLSIVFWDRVIVYICLFFLLCRFLFNIDINIYYMYITLNVTFLGNCNNFFLNHKRNK